MAEERSQHDLYFKSSLSLPRIQVSFLEQHLPEEVLSDMDLTQIRTESELLIDERLKQKVVDVLLSVPYKGRRALIYILIEHQSTVQPMMALRLMVYVFQILERWLLSQKESSGSDGKSLRLPTIFPMVYYNGETEYNGPLVLADLFEDSATFTEMINGPMKVVDLRHVDTQELEHDTWSYVFQTLMKNVHNPEMRQILLDLIPYMRQIEKESSGVDFVVRSFRYLISSAKGCKEKDLAEALQLLNSSRGEIMTIMEQWLEYKDKAENAERRIAEIERQAQLVIARERAEAERARTEGERARTEGERARIEAERARIEAERARTEAERERVRSRERDISSLLANGMNVQTIADCLNVPIALVQRLSDEQAAKGNAPE